MMINCDQIASYYFDNRIIDFINFDIPVMHIASTFNFYNRSSIRTDFRIFGPNKPIIKIDSFKTEKKNI